MKDIKSNRGMAELCSIFVIQEKQCFTLKRGARRFALVFFVCVCLFVLDSAVVGWNFPVQWDSLKRRKCHLSPARGALGVVSNGNLAE